MKIDPNNYDHIMYVDASGDDGFKFDHGSSSCYVAAALLVAKNDIPHNLSVLEKIKDIIGCKRTDEVKYSKIRRHRRSQEALSLLQDLHGHLSCYVVFKKLLCPEDYKGNKILSVVCHYMSLHSLDSYTFRDGNSILIAIDRMKNTEEVPLCHILDLDQNEKARNFHTTTVFRDSKDASFLQIQLADLISGAIREHFEQYESDRNMLYFRSMCPSCEKLFECKKKYVHPFCKNGKSRTAQIIASSNLKHIVGLFPSWGNPALMDYFFAKPSETVHQHFYMFCARKK